MAWKAVAPISSEMLRRLACPEQQTRDKPGAAEKLVVVVVVKASESKLLWRVCRHLPGGRESVLIDGCLGAHKREDPIVLLVILGQPTRCSYAQEA